MVRIVQLYHTLPDAGTGHVGGGAQDDAHLRGMQRDRGPTFACAAKDCGDNSSVIKFNSASEGDAQVIVSVHMEFMRSLGRLAAQDRKGYRRHAAADTIGLYYARHASTPNCCR